MTTPILPFTLSLWFDKLTIIGPYPIVLSLSKDKLSTNGWPVRSSVAIPLRTDQ